MLHQRMFESGSYKSLPEHVALYEALEASMERAQRDEFFAERDKSRKRRRDDQDPPPPPPDFDLNKKKRHDSGTGSAHLPSKIKPMARKVEVFQRKGSFITWFCKRIGKKKLNKSDLEGPTYKGHQVHVTIQSQFFFNKDLEYLVSGDKGKRSALSISKLKAAKYLDFGLEELVPTLWIESEREYDISAASWYLHGGSRRNEFYITRTQCHSVASKADYKEYKISEADFKNLHPNDFEDLYLLHLQGQLNHLSGANISHYSTQSTLWNKEHRNRKRVEESAARILRSYQTKLNLTQPDWDASDFLFKEGLTSDGDIAKDTLNRILDKLDHMVKDFNLFKYNPGMETRIWSEDDIRESKEFMELIERKLKIRRIFRSLESFVGGRLRDADYRLIQRTK
ncbi:hypothetical protein Tco_0375750 [Tanacetum coccineum]